MLGRIRHKTYVTAAFAIAVVLSVGLGYRTWKAREPSWDSKESIERIAKEWKGKIADLGPDKAYDAFKSAQKSKSPNAQHLAMHIFGELLYEVAGARAVTICDDAFLYGCYHSVFAAAVRSGGLGIVTELDQACIAKHGPHGLGCQHGIGHGLGELLGSSRLAEQLAACKTLVWQGPLLGCSGGVFMEYNFPTTVAAGVPVTNLRAFDPEHPIAPCDRVMPFYRRSCLYELGQWWDQVLGHDDGKMGGICGEISGNMERRDCFDGIGKMIAGTTGYNSGLTRTRCRVMPTPEGETYCLAGAAFLFTSSGSEDEAQKLCASLPGSYADTCRQYSNIIEAMN